MSLKTIHGQPSWRIATSNVEAFVTQRGGHLGPVRFRLGDRTVEPFSVAPWAEERVDVNPMLHSLRGDFFCMPFGGNEEPFGTEENLQHGDTANFPWELIALGKESIELSLTTQSRPGKVNKQIQIADNAIYQTHIISEMAGPMCFGHHAMLRFPSVGRISTSTILGGRVFPNEFERPVNGGYTSLLKDAPFEDLKQVPMQNGENADLTTYPAREGFEDLVQIYHGPNAPFAWNAAIVDGYVWLALKDPRVLPATVLWHSNGGRHYAPWNGRHRAVLGIEDVCAYFHFGLDESVKKNDAPVPTFVNLDPARPFEVRHIMAVAAAPETFDVVQEVQATDEGVRLVSQSGEAIDVRVNLDFLGPI